MKAHIKKIEMAKKINEYLLLDKKHNYIKSLILLGNIKYFTYKKDNACLYGRML